MTGQPPPPGQTGPQPPPPLQQPQQPGQPGPARPPQQGAQPFQPVAGSPPGQPDPAQPQQQPPPTLEPVVITKATKWTWLFLAFALLLSGAVVFSVFKYKSLSATLAATQTKYDKAYKTFEGKEGVKKSEYDVVTKARTSAEGSLKKCESTKSSLHGLLTKYKSDFKACQAKLPKKPAADTTPPTDSDSDSSEPQAEDDDEDDSDTDSDEEE